jgi:uncharacterized protein
MMMSAERKSENSECLIELAGVKFTRSLNGAAKNADLQADILKLTSDAKTDFFNSPDGHYLSSTAPLLLSEIDNTQAFTFTTKVTPQFKEKYDAGAIYIYVDNNLWQKFAFEQDDVGTRRIVSVRTQGTSDDCNHQPITDSSVFLKMSSDATTIAFYFSIDGLKWTLVRLYKNNYPNRIGVGISAQSPLGQGNVVLFEHLSLANESVKDFRLGI